MKNALLACAALSLSSYALPAGAQDASLPAGTEPQVAVPLTPAPVIEPQARDEYLKLLARYAAFTSYSGSMALSLENVGLMPEKEAASVAFRARLSWERPNKVRLEGERAGGKFLAVSDGLRCSHAGRSEPQVLGLEGLAHRAALLRHPQRGPRDAPAGGLERALPRAWTACRGRLDGRVLQSVASRPGSPEFERQIAHLLR